MIYDNFAPGPARRDGQSTSALPRNGAAVVERAPPSGISQASIVDTDEKLADRVAFIHEQIGTAAIAEQYIEGRELYVGVLGNNRLRFA